MKPALQLRLGQSLALTPQLQQAIRLLQLSRPELELELNAALEANPLLEQEEDVEDEVPEERADAETNAEDAAATGEDTFDDTHYKKTEKKSICSYNLQPFPYLGMCQSRYLRACVHVPLYLILIRTYQDNAKSNG